MRRSFYAAARLFAGKGAKVFLQCNNGSVLAGELHAVNDSAVMVAYRDAAGKHTAAVLASQIKKVTFENDPAVNVLLKNGYHVASWLQAVGADAVALYKTAAQGSGHFEIPIAEIDRIFVPGKPNTGKGFLGGAVAGIAFMDMMTYGFGINRRPKAALVATNGLMFGTAGMIAGGLDAAIKSQGALEGNFIYRPAAWSVLRAFARHKK